MGVHKNIYIGPYIECVPKRKSVDFVELLDEALFSVRSDNSGIVYLAPNISREGDPRERFDDDGEFHLGITPDMIERETQWFSQAFAEELEKVRAACRTSCVKWGAHQFYM